MATYSPEQLGIKPPAGGFQQGGWYAGRQYWGGTLSDLGVIHPSSDQQGAGQEVSKEVVQQTNPANWEYLQQEKAKQAAQQQTSVTSSGTKTPSGTPTPSTGNQSGSISLPQVPTIDLNSIYKNLYASSGIADIEKSIADTQAKLTQMQAGYTEAVSGINDNPYLSEATRVGRNQKLSTDYQNSLVGVQNELTMKKNDLAMKKADIETQMNIQLKQFDINSAASKQALDQFNLLLSSGALAGATGEDIANITKATGISSSMIQSAIAVANKKNIPTSTLQFDDGTNQGFAIINSDTGEIISKQIIAASKPTAATKATTDEKIAYYSEKLREDAAAGAKLGQIFSAYTGFLEPDLIYQLYNANSKWGPDKGDYNKLVTMYGLKAQPQTSQITGL